MATQDQGAWVYRVLGVWTAVGDAPQGAEPHTAPATPGSTAPAPEGHLAPAELLALFRDAKEEVDTGLNELQKKMRETENEDMIRVADYGMYGMTSGEGVGLMKALFDLRAAAPDRRDAMAKAARDAAAAYKAAVFKHKLVDLVDRNPFGVKVGIKVRLGAALDTIARNA